MKKIGSGMAPGDRESGSPDHRSAEGQRSEMVERVGAELRRACLAEFGRTWSNDVAWRFARAAIAAMREPTKAMERSYYAACDEAGMVLWKTGYRAIIDAALADETMIGHSDPQAHREPDLKQIPEPK